MALDTSITLTETFHYDSATHKYDIEWTSLGDSSSPPLIFIHGTPWSSQVWTPFALSLSRQFHVYLFDNPGFGSSPLEAPLPSTEFHPTTEVERLDSDLARQTAAYAALFKDWKSTWGGARPHVIAHDHGGLMSLRAHLLHGCQYASLCLIDVVAIGPFGQPLFKSVAEYPEYFEQLSASVFEGILESYIRDAAHAELSRDVMNMLKQPWLQAGGKEGFVRQLCQANSRNTEEVEGLYEEVGKTMPVKVIWGKEDRWILQDTADKLGKALGAKEIVKVEAAGHLIMYDQPAQLGIEIEGWLTAAKGELYAR